MKIAGTKDKLAKRYAKHMIKRGDLRAAKDELKEFLGPNEFSSDRPVVTQHYRDSFNHVDRFNSRRSFIRYKPTMLRERLLILIALIEVAAVQTYGLATSWIEDEEKDKETLRTFLIDLAASL